MRQRQNSTHKFLALVWVLTALSASFWAGWTLLQHPEILDTNILHLLPHGESPQERQISTLVTSLSQNVILLIGHPNQDSAELAADQAEQILRQSPLFSDLQYKEYAQLERDFYQVYFPVRNNLLSPQYREELQHPASTNKFLSNKALANLTSPAGGFLAQLLPQDPLLLFPAWLTSLRGNQQKMEYHNGAVHVSAQGIHYVLIRLQLAESPFSSATQNSFQSTWQKTIQKAHDFSPQVQIFSTGTIRFARQGRLAAEREMTLIGLLSSGALLLLFVWLFRGFRHLLIGLLPVLFGIGVGLAVGILVFGRLHVITQAMGMSLVGICVDYTFFYFLGNTTPSAAPVLRRILPGLTMGMLTTMVAYLALASCGFPGLVQIAVVSTSGILASWLTVVLLFPWLIPEGKTPGEASHSLAKILVRWPKIIRSRAGIIVTLTLLCAAVAGMVLHLQITDDIRMFQSLPPELKAEDEAVQRLLGRLETNRLFLVQGQNMESLLQHQEILVNQLNQAVDSGWLEQFHALAQFLPSRSRQKENQGLIAQWMHSSIVRNDYASTIGLDTTGWSNVYPDSLFLDYSAITHSSLRLLTPPVIRQTDGQLNSIILLQGVSAPSHLQTLGNDSTIQYYDQVQTVSNIFARYLRNAILVLIIGNLAVLVLMSMRYGLKKSLLGKMPPLIAILITTGIFAWLGIPLQFFTILAFTLVIGAGEDYTIFLIEDKGNIPDHTWTAIFLSALTTILSFGLLAFSSTEALAGFGFAVFLGCTLSFLMAPLGVHIAKLHLSHDS